MRADLAPRWRFAAMLAGFVALTALGLWWAAPDRAVVWRSWRELVALGAGPAALLAAIAAAVIAAEVYRLVVFGRVLGVPVGLRAAFDASMANNLLSWISPGGALGEPAAVYVMSRRGVPVDAALAIAFAKFATSFALIMGVACALLLGGHGPAVPRWAVVSIAVTIGFGVVLVGSFVVGALWPTAALRVLGRIERATARWGIVGRLAVRVAGVVRRSIDRLAGFRSAGVRGWLAITMSHVAYYGAYVGLLVALAHLFGARSVLEVVPIAVVYQAFTYIAPAPGIPEAGAAAFFGGLLPDGGAFVVVLLFRALTAYAQIALGLGYLAVAGMLPGILAHEPAPRSRPGTPPG